MKKILFCILLLLVINSCSKVPLTGRKQILLFSDKEIMALSLDNYNKYLKENGQKNQKIDRTLVTQEVYSIEAQRKSIWNRWFTLTPFTYGCSR